MEHPVDQRVPEERMHPAYREQERILRTEAAKLWQAEEALRASLRSTTDLSSAERADIYRSRHGELQRRYEALTEKFSADVSKGMSEARKTLTAGSGPRFSEHLTAVAGIRDEKLPEVMATARRSGQEDLQHVIALTAYERGQRGVWESWASAQPQRAEAIRVLRTTPGGAQHNDRTRTLRPPRADEVDLEPTKMDVQAAREKAAAADAGRRAFFQANAARPRRQVGSRRY